MVVDKYGNYEYVRKFMCQLCGRVDICMTLHMRAFDFLYTIAHNFQNCATMNCQRNVNSILPTDLPHKFSYIVAILIHNHFKSPNILRLYFEMIY
jgi:hypothetical protein